MKVVFACLCLSVLFAVSPAARAAEGDTTVLPLIVKDRFPGTPSNLDATVFFPTKSWARIILKLKLECPCGKGLGEWDYTNTYYIKVPTGKKDSLGNATYDNLEIARFITPYWGNQPGSSNYSWQWDITDYAYLMKDSTKFSVRYDGYTSSAVFNVWVEAIEGTAPYNVYAIDKLWQQSFLYGNMKDPIDNHLLNKKFRSRDEAKFVKLRITNTGHGGYGKQVVAEFVNKTHTIALNNVNVFTQHLWRSDCGSNPYYPQDGTWAYPRAGWCPGDIVPYWDWDITSYVKKGDSTRLDYKMEKFDVDSSCNGIYSISTQVMYAGEPNFQNDVSLEEILAPNSDVAKTKYNRMNPICGNPIVRVRNNGKKPATSISFEYGVKGEAMKTYTWTGSMDQMEVVDITLPAPDWKASFAASTRTFECRVVKTNNVTDEYPLFNTLTSVYSVPPTFDSKIEVNFKTNLQAQNQGYFWQLRDSNDSLISERQSSTLADNTLFVDSLSLAPGCYIFQFVNPESIGLEWWATSGQVGAASLSLTSHGTTVKKFNGDCGNGVYQQFIVGIIPQLRVLNGVEAIDFGAVALGDSVQKTVSVSALNSAGLDVTKAAVVALAKGFSLVKTEPVIPTGGKLHLTQDQNLTVTVQYKPVVTARKSASLNIESNDFYEPSYSIPMAGGAVVSGIDDEESASTHLKVLPSTTSAMARILFSVDAVQSSNARCSLYNALGQEVRVLFDNVVKPYSENEINSEVTDLPSGVYFVVLRSGKSVSSAPLMITR